MEERKKAMPIGNDNFKKLIKKDLYYVDKTKFIEEIVESKSEVLLFTRPRRFGKSLNLSTIRYFFDVKDNEENRKLFEGLYIENSPVFEMQGKHPVISISFKELKFSSWEKCFSEIKILIADLYDKFECITEKISNREKRKFQEVLNEENHADWIGSLKRLSRNLCEYYGEKVVILIDEYDEPIQNAYLNGYYDEALEFFRNFYSATFKGNEYLELGVLTGITRVAREGIFSGLNNLRTYNILDDNYDEYFGITEDEVDQMIEIYDERENSSDIQEWYNGYLFGNKKVYNPWSTLNYFAEKKFKAYWVNTSGNDLIRNLLKKADTSVFDELSELFKGNSITKIIDDRLDYRTLENTVNENIWHLFLYAGYLTITGEKEGEDSYSLTIPNKEVYRFFSSTFIRNIFGSEGDKNYDIIVKHLEKGEIVEFGKKIGEVLEEVASFYDYTKDDGEKLYHGIMIGLTAMLRYKYHIRSNREAGEGRADLTFEPIPHKQDFNKDNTAYIFEFKFSKSAKELGTASEIEKVLEKDAKQGLEQIEEFKYDADLKARGFKNIVKIGMSFFRDKVWVEYERKGV